MTQIQAAKCEALFDAMAHLRDKADDTDDDTYRRAAHQIIEDLGVHVLILSAAGGTPDEDQTHDHP